MSQTYEFTCDGRKYVVTAEKQDDQIEISWNGKTYTVVVESSSGGAKKKSGGAKRDAAARGSSGGGDQIAAPMTGVVKSMSVGVGDSVSAGQVVMVMEAMKMDVDVQSPRDGKIAAIAVNPGDSVNAKQSLMTLE